MTPEQAEKYRFDPFDLTKVWPHADFPPIVIGRLVLNRNPENYFAEVEQAAFSPANFVPGIGASPDKMLQGRLFSYHDTHRHRLGPNYHLIPVNAPKAARVDNYERDGFMRTDGNFGGAPNYYPNSFGGPEPTPEVADPPFEVSGRAARQKYIHPNDDFVQAGALYKKVMTDTDREHLVGNIVEHLAKAQKRIQYRQCAVFCKADPDYGRRVAEGLNLSVKDVVLLANMSQEDRAQATKQGSYTK
jgi:catalase